LCPSKTPTSALCEREDRNFLEKEEMRRISRCKEGIGVPYWADLGPAKKPGPYTYELKKELTLIHSLYSWNKGTIFLNSFFFLCKHFQKLKIK